jgi:hypothetical protein
MMWNLAFLFDLPQIWHLRRKRESISIVNKLTLVIFECLFHNYFAFDFKLMFNVLCRDIQPDCFSSFHFMFWGTSSQAPFRTNTYKNMLKTWLDTWPHYPLPNPLRVRDHMTMVFQNLLNMRQHNVWSNISFAIYVFFYFVVGIYFVLFGVFFWTMFNLYHHSI